MNAQVAVQTTLQAKFAELQRNNSRFSLRAYAKRMGINPGALSAILNGKRAVSMKMALRISQKLMLDPQERSVLVAAFQEKTLSRKCGNDLEFVQLTSAQFRVLAEWEHFALLSLMNTFDFKSGADWIASRLGISVIQVNQAVDRLISLGLITKTSSGKLKRSQTGFRTSDDIADISVRKFHDLNLDLAKNSLHRDSVETRDFSATTFAIDPKKLAEAKAIIRKCQDDLAALLECGTQREVYRFSCQLFPLSVIRPKPLKERNQ